MSTQDVIHFGKLLLTTKDENACFQIERMHQGKVNACSRDQWLGPGSASLEIRCYV